MTAVAVVHNGQLWIAVLNGRWLNRLGALMALKVRFHKGSGKVSGRLA